VDDTGRKNFKAAKVRRKNFILVFYLQIEIQYAVQKKRHGFWVKAGKISRPGFRLPHSSAGGIERACARSPMPYCPY